jgi:BON domain
MSAKMKESITDSELQRDVLDELKWDPGVNAAHIGVSAKNGVVGYVPSYWEKYAAEKAAKRVYGVMAVANERGQATGQQPTHRRGYRRGLRERPQVEHFDTLRQDQGCRQ